MIAVSSGMRVKSTVSKCISIGMSAVSPSGSALCKGYGPFYDC